MPVHAKTMTSSYSGTVSKPRHLKATALRAYSDQKKKLIEDDRIIELLPMVPKIAKKVISYLKPPLTFEDIIAAGTVGLVKAAKDYDPSHQAEFKTYAYIRIKGSILDELKRWSFLSPEMNRNISAANQQAREFKQKTGTAPSDEQLAEKLGVSVDKLNNIYEGARTQMFLSIDAANANSCSLLQNILCDEQSSPEDTIEQTELINQLTEAISQLSPKKRQTIILYYQKNLTMKQIADVLSITESRVSQLHASAIFTLSLKLREWRDAGQ